MDQKIQFFFEGTNFDLKKKKEIRIWVNKLIRAELKIPHRINFIFCDDAYLIHLNRIYLLRDYYTDVISFDFAKSRQIVSGDIYISMDRIKENAKKFRQPIDNELLRIMFHGVLHLAGYKDSNLKDKSKMREKEDHYLLKFHES